MPSIIPSAVCVHLSFFSSSSIDHRTLRAQFIKNWILYLSWMFLYLEKKHGTIFFFSEKSHFCHSINPCFSQLLTGRHSSLNCYTTLELPNWMYKRKFNWKNDCCVLRKWENNSHLSLTCTRSLLLYSTTAAPALPPSLAVVSYLNFPCHLSVGLLISYITLALFGAVFAIPTGFSVPVYASLSCTLRSLVRKCNSTQNNFQVPSSSDTARYSQQHGLWRWHFESRSTPDDLVC